jgi:hypothetical protein
MSPRYAPHCFLALGAAATDCFLALGAAAAAAAAFSVAIARQSPHWFPIPISALHLRGLVQCPSMSPRYAPHCFLALGAFAAFAAAPLASFAIHSANVIPAAFAAIAAFAAVIHLFRHP